MPDPEPEPGDDDDDHRRKRRMKPNPRKVRGGGRRARGDEPDEGDDDVFGTISEALVDANSHNSMTVSIDERRMGELVEGMALDAQGTIVLSGVHEKELVDGPPGKRKIGLGGRVTYAGLSSAFAISFSVTDTNELEVTDAGITNGKSGGQLSDMADEIVPMLRDITALLEDSLGTRIPSGWTVTSIKIVGNKLQLKFGKKTS